MGYLDCKNLMKVRVSSSEHVLNAIREQLHLSIHVTFLILQHFSSQHIHSLISLPHLQGHLKIPLSSSPWVQHTTVLQLLLGHLQLYKATVHIYHQNLPRPSLLLLHLALSLRSTLLSPVQYILWMVPYGDGYQ